MNKNQFNPLNLIESVHEVVHLLIKKFIKNSLITNSAKTLQLKVEIEADQEDENNVHGKRYSDSYWTFSDTNRGRLLLISRTIFANDREKSILLDTIELNIFKTIKSDHTFDLLVKETETCFLIVFNGKMYPFICHEFGLIIYDDPSQDSIAIGSPYKTKQTTDRVLMMIVRFNKTPEKDSYCQVVLWSQNKGEIAIMERQHVQVIMEDIHGKRVPQQISAKIYGNTKTTTKTVETQQIKELIGHAIPIEQSQVLVEEVAYS